MTTSDMTSLLQALLSAVRDGDFDVTVGSLLSAADIGGLPGVERVRTFAEDGVLTRSQGLRVTLDDGERIDITVSDR